MKTSRRILAAALAIAAACMLQLAPAAATSFPPSIPAGEKVKPMKLSDADWKKKLTPRQYHVLREKGTDVPFTGPLLHVKGAGVFKCAACGLELFRTDQKFESGTGWPSFWAPYALSHVVEIEDHTLGMERIEVECARCGGHLGHVFDDGPEPTGLRYCINSSALTFTPNAAGTPAAANK
jgi:peptide-methionine (R)-S-oxide reductase